MAKIPEYYSTPAWIELRNSVLKRDNYICQYCGEKGLQADHVVPRSRGGKDHVSNLVAACQSCNRIAGGLEFSSFEKKRDYILKYRKKRSLKSRKNKRRTWLRIMGD